MVNMTEVSSQIDSILNKKRSNKRTNEITSLKSINTALDNLIKIAAEDPMISESSNKLFFGKLYMTIIPNLPENSYTIGFIDQIKAIFNFMAKMSGNHMMKFHFLSNQIDGFIASKKSNEPFYSQNLKWFEREVDAKIFVNKHKNFVYQSLHHFLNDYDFVWEKWAANYLNEKTLIIRLKKYFPKNTKVAVNRPFKTSDANIINITKSGVRVMINQGEMTGKIGLIPMNIINHSKTVNQEIDNLPLNKADREKMIRSIHKTLGTDLTELSKLPDYDIKKIRSSKIFLDPIVKLKAPEASIKSMGRKLEQFSKGKGNTRDFELITNEIAYYANSYGISKKLENLINAHSELIEKFSLNTSTVKQVIDSLNEEQPEYDTFTSEDPMASQSLENFDTNQGVGTYDQTQLVKIKNNKPKTPEGVIIDDFLSSVFSNQAENELDLIIPKEVFNDISKMKSIIYSKGIDADTSNILNAIVIARVFFQLNSVLPSPEFINPYLLESCGEGTIFDDTDFITCSATLLGKVRDIKNKNDQQIKKIPSSTLLDKFIKLYQSELGLKIYPAKRNYNLEQPFNYQVDKILKNHKIYGKPLKKPVFMKFDPVVYEDLTARINSGGKVPILHLPHLTPPHSTLSQQIDLGSLQGKKKKKKVIGSLIKKTLTTQN